jgi:PKD repeat protein
MLGVSRSYLRPRFLTADDRERIMAGARRTWPTVVASFIVLTLVGSTLLAVSPIRPGRVVSSNIIVDRLFDANAVTAQPGNAPVRSMGSIAEAVANSGTIGWTNLTGPVAPPRVNYVSAAYDPVDHYLVTFGGQNASAYPTNQTWVWENGTWINVTATAGPAPVARMGMALTYDPADGYVLAYGGGGFFATCGTKPATACNSSWAFYGGKWHVLATSGPSPPVSMQLDMVYDAADSYVVASDGFSTWTYRAGAWTELCGTTGNCSNPQPPPPRFSGAMAYDPQASEVLYFGDRSTWKFAEGNWSNITSTSGAPPPSGQYAMMTDDPATGSVLYFGGLAPRSAGGWAYLNDTWSFVGGTWTNVTPAQSPPGRYAGALAYDSDASAVVLFGGDTQLGAGGDLNDTWVWGTSPPIGELVPSVSPSSPLPGTTAVFAVSFKGGVGPFTYSWRFGDGNASSLANPTHVFAKAGFYQVQLWVNDSAGHSANTSLVVHVYVPLAVTALEALPNPAALGEPVNFTATVVGGTPPYTFAWVFGDGGTGGNLSSITHVFTTNGPFTTVVTVRDAVGGAAHGYLNISIKLQALAAASASSGGSPLTVSFVGEAQGGTPPYAYSWSFGDGGTSTAQDPRHTYDSSGLFNVVLNVTDRKQNHSSTSLVIQVGSPSAGSSSSWFYEFLGAALVAVAIGGLWAAIFIRQRIRRREGEEWVEELTSHQETGDTQVPPPP